MSAPVRVVLVDDHALCRNGLTDLLEHRGGMQVLAATGDPDHVLPLLREHQPDLLVLDLRMPGIDGLTLLRRMRAEGCDTPVVILTMSDAEDDLAAALRAGVRGYLLKDMEPEDVIGAIGRAARGELVVAPAMTLKLAQMLQSGPKGDSREQPVRLADRARAPDPRPPGARREQQDHRARAGHQPRHREAARAPHPVQAEPELARRGGGLRGRVPRHPAGAAQADEAPRKPTR